MLLHALLKLLSESTANNYGTNYVIAGRIVLTKASDVHLVWSVFVLVANVHVHLQVLWEE